MAAVSKLDYLKRYMSKDSDHKDNNEKRKKKRAKKTKNLTIIDNDIKYNDAIISQNDDSDEFAVEDEKPQVFVDGLTLLSEHLEKTKKGEGQKWAPISQNSRHQVLGSSSKHHSLDLSPKRLAKKRQDSPDLSPTRIKRIQDCPDISSRKHNKRHDTPDLSPQRSHKRHDFPDLSPKHSHKRHDSPDLSPQRSHRRNDSPDLSPKRLKKRHDSPDNSSRKPYRRHDTPDLSPQKSRKRHDSPDLSPKRLKKRHDSPDNSSRKPYRRHDTPDLSPQRSHKRHDSPDLSLKRSNKRQDSPDLSPKRSHKRHDSPDMSPKRSSKKHGSPHSSPKRSHEYDLSKHRKQSDKRREVKPEIVKAGKKSGLQSAELLREENKNRRLQEDAYFASMDNAISGKDTGTIYRDKSGKKIDPKLERIKKREAEEKKAQEDERSMKWGKGIQQVDEYAKKLNEDLYEMSKPLARYKDDEDLDEMLKMQDRAGDPMLEFMKKSKAKAKNNKEKPRYKGPNPPPNRFNLWPGYRWDGVDRSNGFEKKRFETIAERKTVAIDAYKWSVEDM